MSRSCMFSLFMPIDLIEKLEKSVKEKKFPSKAEALRSYASIGIWVETLKASIKDPEFLKTIKELMKTDGIFHWTETLNDQQLDAIASALKMEKEQRYEKGVFR